MASVLVLNQYFPPDPVPTARHVQAIAARLAREGHSVTALVGQPSYVAGIGHSPAREAVDGVEVVRIDLGSCTGRQRMARRLSGYARYLAGAWRRSRAWDPDLVICFHNPPVLGLVAAIVARRSGARFVYVVHDIHPDIVLAAGWPRVPRPLARVWEAASRRMLRSADRTVVLGDGMKGTLVDGKGAVADLVEVLPPWPEPELEPRPRDLEWRREHGIGDGELLVLCAGNMGIMHPMEPVLDAAAALAGRPVSFLIVGRGVKREHWERETSRRGLGKVRFLDYASDEEFPRIVAAADVAVVALAEGMERFAVPSRGYTFLSAGRPVIAQMAPDADLARVVEESGAGWRVGDGASLGALLERLAGEPGEVAAAGVCARATFERNFRGEAITGRYARLVDDELARR